MVTVCKRATARRGLRSVQRLQPSRELVANVVDDNLQRVAQAPAAEAVQDSGDGLRNKAT